MSANNIKCRINRSLVQAALNACQALLRQYKEIPNNGLAIFVGGEDNHRFVFEPPMPIPRNQYLCDKRFYVELVMPLYQVHETVAYIIVHGDSALYAMAQGTKLTLFSSTQGHLQNDTRRGGQSAPRFGRIAERKRENYAKRICERANELFGPLSGRVVNRIVLGGPADIKSRVLEGWNLELQPIVKTISRGGEEGLRECIEKSQQDLNGQRVQEDLDVLGEFYRHLQFAPDTIVVGNEVAELYHQGLIRAIWTTDKDDERLETIDRLEVDEDANLLNQNGGESSSNPRMDVNQGGLLLGFGASLFVVSPDTDLGARFEREFQGLAAVTWVPTHNVE
jgi:peptide chain release factor subunit 1